jgi:hypothetical protein
MAKKPPKLTLVENGGRPPFSSASSPRKLGEYGIDLWNRVMGEYAINDVGGQQLLAQACAAAQRAEDLAVLISDEGATIHTKNGLRAHPCIAAELAARNFVVRTLSRLGITSENIKPVGRPAQGFGWQGDNK